MSCGGLQSAQSVIRRLEQMRSILLKTITGSTSSNRRTAGYFQNISCFISLKVRAFCAPVTAAGTISDQVICSFSFQENGTVIVPNLRSGGRSTGSDSAVPMWITGCGPDSFLSRSLSIISATMRLSSNCIVRSSARPQGRNLISGSEFPKIIDKARAYLQDSVESDISMPEVAKYLNMSYTTFRHAFKKYTGLSPAQYFFNLKLHRAKEMLRGTTASVKEISYMLHFESPEYFATAFRKKTGQSPSEFRKA